jgi:hypothetical protein
MVKWATTDHLRKRLLRPMALDALIMDDLVWGWSRGIVQARNRLIQFVRSHLALRPCKLPIGKYSSAECICALQEHLKPEEYLDGLLKNAVYDLHNLSQHWHIISGHLNGTVDQIDYLLGVQALVAPAWRHRVTSRTSEGIAASESSLHYYTSVEDSLLFLRSRTALWHRWVQNYRERNNIRINLFFNLSSQRVADLTSQIAKETQDDSSSMTT